MSGPGLDKEATIKLTKTHAIITHPSGEIEKLAFSDIKKVESPDPATLYILPKDIKPLAIKDDGRWGVYFGDHWVVRAYGTLPVKWQYKAGQSWEADKKAVAFYLAINDKLQ